MRLHQEILLCLGATFCVAIGICLYTDCHLGADSITVFLDGMNKTTGLSISLVDQILVIIMFISAYFMNKHNIGICTIIHTVTIGILIMFVSLFITPLELTKQSLPVRCLGVLLAELCFCFGFAFMQKLSSGMATADAFIYGIVEKTHLSYIKIHFIFDSVYFIIGYLLGGIIGIGSIVYVLTSGWITFQIKKRIDNVI